MLFNTTQDLENYLNDVDGAVKEITKTVYSFSEVQYLQSKVVRYTPNVIQHIVNFSVETTKPVVYYSAKWMGSWFVENKDLF
jgi:hypothetical protein